jgi:nucleotide-binding universal stress UspA family protein
MQEADVSAPILVAYSPKSGDRGPVNFAEAAARATGAPIVVLAAEAGGADAGGQLRAELGLGDDVEVRAAEGSPTRAIAAAVEELKPGLVVVGSTHRGGFGRIMPGSTAERLIHGSAAPVVVVPHQHEVRAGGARTVAAGFENTDEGRTALRVAAGLARSLGAKLLAVLVPRSRRPACWPGRSTTRTSARTATRSTGSATRTRSRPPSPSSPMGWRPSPTSSSRSPPRAWKPPRTGPT